MAHLPLHRLFRGDSLRFGKYRKKVIIGHKTIICGQTMAQRSNSGFDQYRGIYLKRIPTYSFPLMLQVMEEFGIAAEQVLKNTGVEATALSQEDTRVSFLQAVKFVRNLIARSPRTDIGLEIGDRYQISTYGVLGYAMMSCSTWGDALKRARHYHRVASSLVHIDMEHDESAGTLTYIAKPVYPDLVEIEPCTVEKPRSSAG